MFFKIDFPVNMGSQKKNTPSQHDKKTKIPEGKI